MGVLQFGHLYKYYVNGTVAFACPIMARIILKRRDHSLYVTASLISEVCAGKGLLLVEVADGVSLEDVRTATGSSFEVWEQLLLVLSW